MPYTPAQNRLFRAAEYDKDIADRHGLSQREAGKLADEGVKKEDKPKAKKVSFVDMTPVFGAERTPR